MFRIYANENFPRVVAEALRQKGHDVLTSREAGKAGQAIPDAEVLAFAVADDRAILTLNRRDFIRLHNLSATHAGIIVCTYDPDLAALASRIEQAIVSRVSLHGLLIRIVRPN